MYMTTRQFFPRGIEGEEMDCTWKEWNDLDKAIAYCHRYAKGVRFVRVTVEDEDGNLIYELTDNGIITDNRQTLAENKSLEEVKEESNSLNYHYMKLQSNPFNAIKNKSKNIEYRLYDERRSKIQTGDIIIFENIETHETIQVKVLNLYRAKNFIELKQKLCEKSIIIDKDFSPNMMKKYYSQQNIDRYGVIGIQINIII